MRTAIVLAGHGSHLSPQTAGLVWAHVDALRRLQIADEITAAFWKESPSFSHVLSTLTADDITIVPVFTAQGYFTRSVIPTEMGLHGAVTTINGRTVRYARTLSEHPCLAQIVRDRVQTALYHANVSSDQVAVAILGHSTKRNPDSRLATESQAALIRQSGLVSEVVALYLDDTPGIDQLYQFTTAPVVIAVPFFVALGSHVTIDVPARLGLPPNATHGNVQGRDLIYTDPVGIDDTLGQVILDLAIDAGAPLRQPTASTSAWIGFPTAGHAEFLQFALTLLESSGEFHFAQLRITSSAVHHIDDSAAENLVSLTTPDQLRRYLREFLHFRPLPTSTDLPHGWRVPIIDLSILPAIIETIYPGLITAWVLSRQNNLPISTLPAVIDRQVGMFRQLAHLDDAHQQEIVSRVCGNCVLHPTWFDGMYSALPCAEVCNRWLSTALESLPVAEALR